MNDKKAKKLRKEIIDKFGPITYAEYGYKQHSNDINKQGHLTRHLICPRLQYQQAKRR